MVRAKKGERLELVVRHAVSGADTAGVEFRGLAAARKYLRRFQAAIGGDAAARRDCGAFAWDVIESAWVAGAESGAVYCE